MISFMVDVMTFLFVLILIILLIGCLVAIVCFGIFAFKKFREELWFDNNKDSEV